MNEPREPSRKCWKAPGRELLGKSCSSHLRLSSTGEGGRGSRKGGQADLLPLVLCAEYSRPSGGAAGLPSAWGESERRSWGDPRMRDASRSPSGPRERQHYCFCNRDAVAGGQWVPTEAGLRAGMCSWRKAPRADPGHREAPLTSASAGRAAGRPRWSSRQRRGGSASRRAPPGCR